MKEFFKAEISGYGYDGEGVARLDGKVVFLPYALRGEQVEFVKTQEKSKFSRGKVVNIIKKHSRRCKPPCPYFEKCGGCTFQHAEYEYELEIKKELLLQQLQKVGYVGDVLVVGSLNDYGYRNKIRLFVGAKGLCLKERGSNNLTPIEKCLLVNDKINDAIEKINNFIISNKLQDTYSEVVIRQEQGKILVNFVRKNEIEINYQGLYLLLKTCGIFETIRGVCVHRIGIDFLEVEEMGLKCEFSIRSFHQVNSFLTQSLYQGIIDNISGDSVINCYSGAGVLSGVIAKQGKDVTAIELGISEHLDAEKLKKNNNLENLTNLCGDCSEVLANLNQKVDTIIVDPPRMGMSAKVCSSLNEKNCKKLIYVSCNSATLVRDLSLLNKFVIKKVWLYDMFARTGEYEILCILERR